MTKLEALSDIHLSTRQALPPCSPCSLMVGAAVNFQKAPLYPPARCLPYTALSCFLGVLGSQEGDLPRA